MYHMVFDDNGYYFLSTSDIETGLMFCKGKTEKPNIVLLDILLPSKNKEIDKEGFKFLEQLKKDPKTKDIPVVILTNLDTGEDMKRGMDLGAEDYIIKAGHSPQVVLKRVEKVLEESKKKK
ncbi:MAG: Adenylate/guanylate cyclase [Parcubacteria group bacterium GW2011_GWA2_38_13]|nr:MAG: Adenylate/guanylate cyclase [Parcubacteria group bacterium GW2011_GWA2_38_13]